MDKLFKKVLEKITPSEAEHKAELELYEDVARRAKKMGVTPILVGSLAKETDVRGDKDIDVFIMFHHETSRAELEKRGLEIGEKILSDLKMRCEIDYAEHPYVCGHCGQYKVEIVPCYETRTLKSAVDRTPHHTEYVKKKLFSAPQMRAEIRLLKQFMKAAGVYGAEAKIQGFSGYLTELLVIKYGSFQNVLKEASEWHFGETLDPEHMWEDAEALKYFFTGAVLVVVDPIDKDRNVAAAVSKQKMAEFMVAARAFLKKPSEDAFFPKKEKPASSSELRKRLTARGTELLALSFSHGKVNENNLYAQLRKTCESVKKHADSEGFRVLKTDSWTDEEKNSIVLLDFEVSSLPRLQHRTGPPVDQDLRQQEKFLKKYAEYRPYLRDGHYVVDKKRRYTKASDLLKEMINEGSGFGKDLREAKAKVVPGADLLKTVDESLLRFLSDFLTPVPK